MRWVEPFAAVDLVVFQRALAPSTALALRKSGVLPDPVKPTARSQTFL